ncbi:MAG: D-2-hydroxyacid dehydrogenase [Clostridiales bacterium]|nr:D-2-hydroxyacid dehydrogenase [Clostridiales bacterium]
MKIVLLEGGSLGEDISLDGFNEIGETVIYSRSDIEENAERIRDADVIVLNKIPVDGLLLENAEKAKLVCLTATGTNNVNFDYTNSRGITVCNVKGYSTESVAQHSFAMLLSLYEHLPYYDRFVKSGDYSRSKCFSVFDYGFNELYGKTFGIIGLGAIGRASARIAKAFGCRVIYYSTSGMHYDEEYERTDLETLLSVSDVIAVHAPLNERTRGLISYEGFKLMKKNAVILNTGRGGIIDEDALYDALVNDRIMAAGLDVLQVEPMDPGSPLLKIQDSNRLIITPHIGWGTVEARTRCVEEVILNIKAYFAGTPRNVVTGN